jgi:Zn-finger nucleic acid-binding protein
MLHSSEEVQEAVCPSCRRPMIVYELDGVEIDRCLDCGGTWLDSGELEAIARSAGTADPELPRTVRDAPAGPKGARRCPRCARPLRAIGIGKEKRIELDRCPRCGGLWLDRGELEAVIASFSEGEEGAVARFFSEVFRSERSGTKGV